MPERIARVAQEYAHRQVHIGERFDVEPQHVPLLLTLGRIEPEPGEPGFVARNVEPEAPMPYQTRDMAAQSPRAYKRKASTQ